VVLDNLSAHKSRKAQQLVEDAGCSWLFLPSYSPDFNPIEMLWSKFKSDLRREAPALKSISMNSSGHCSRQRLAPTPTTGSDMRDTT
jgi:transposase